jgi:hypothetical protein
MSKSGEKKWYIGLVSSKKAVQSQLEALLLITVIETPIMPVGTVASVGVHQRIEEDINPDIILGTPIIYITYKWNPGESRWFA